MKTRSALVAALVCGGAAVALVGADLALNVDAKLEMRAPDGTWKVAARLGEHWGYPSQAFCGSEFRFTLANGLLWPTTVHVLLMASGAGPTEHIVDEEWTLGPGETRQHTFTVSNRTFDPGVPSREGMPRGPDKGYAHVQVTLDGDHRKTLAAGACLEDPA